MHDERDGILPKIEHPEVMAMNQSIEADIHLSRHPGLLVRWPFPAVDMVTGPMGPGEVWYVCAFSGGGKTTFMGSVIDRWRLAGKRVYVMPLELQPWRFRLYLACMALGVHPGDALSGNLRNMPNGDAHADALKAELRAQAQPPYVNQVMVSSQRAITVKGLEAGLREAKSFGADVVVVDHIDHIEPNGGASDNGYRDTVAVQHAAARMVQDNGMLLVATSQLNNSIVSNGQDRLARYQPPREHHVLMGSKKRDVCTGMIGLFRPLRTRGTNETNKEYLESLKAARQGYAEPRTALEPHAIGVNAMKLRNYGQNEGDKIVLAFHSGRVEEIAERDHYATGSGYVRKVL